MAKQKNELDGLQKSGFYLLHWDLKSQPRFLNT